MKKYRDEICRLGKCPNVGVCKGLCPPLVYVNGKSKSKEVLLSNLIDPEKIEFRDYKADLIALAEDNANKKESTFERMIELTDGIDSLSFYHQRKIAAVILLTLNFRKPFLEKCFKVGTTTLWKILK